MPSRGLLNSAINPLPFELHIPGYQFCGPGTRLEQRLARDDRGINPLDAACREHEYIEYSHSNDLTERHAADNIIAEKARKRITGSDSTLAATAVWAAMKAKTKIGMGLKTKKKKRSKRILPTAKRGGVLPVLPLLGVLGSLVGWAAGVAKAVNDSKAAQRQLEELQRYNRVMEGRGVYLAPYKRGRGVARRKKNVDGTLKMPRGVTTDMQLQQLANSMRIPYYRGVFMRTTLPVEGVRRNESGIVNLDNAAGPGTHWVAYAKRGIRVVYFDSFGNLRPPKELERYLVNSVIEYNRTPHQRYNQNNCGQLCLLFLLSVDKQFKDRHCAV
ncbi:hypothetical protein ALC57_14510 [Trachymyrmex cornetzi]|uniref:Phospholipase A2-like domain-containing protein n=1 Tax=Trachymyrmex cornetzi TaxID=471704 RepID=A0A151IYJ0_9HYME|nr:hypothetical protein ALC57_14510 [Trachymyrmex cornetzi]